MKQIKGSRWAPELRCCHIPYTTDAWDSLKTVFADYEIIREAYSPAVSGQVEAETAMKAASDEKQLQQTIIPQPPVAPFKEAQDKLANPNTQPGAMPKGRPMENPNPLITS